MYKTTLILIAFLISACGAGGSGNSGPDPTAPTPPPQSASGIWRGSVCIIDEPLDSPGHEAHGRSSFACLLGEQTAAGWVLVSDGDVSGRARAYTTQAVGDGPITGSLDGQNLTLNLEGQQLNLSYDPIYETGGVPLSELSGVYDLVTVSAWYQNNGASDIQTSGLVIDPDGSYFLQYGDCVLRGNLIKSEQNAYIATRQGDGASSGDCQIPGFAYDGLAFMDGTQLTIAMFNSDGWISITAD